MAVAKSVGMVLQLKYAIETNLIGASLSKPHNGNSLSWFHTSHVQTVRMIKCDWIWEKPPSTHNYKYLEIPILIIWSSITREGK